MNLIERHPYGVGITVIIVSAVATLALFAFYG